RISMLLSTGSNGIQQLCCFFFQAEDGIRDLYVTGVQTCALPIFAQHARPGAALHAGEPRLQPEPRQASPRAARHTGWARRVARRSEERRVGKESRFRWSPSYYKKKGNEPHTQTL